MHSTTQNYLSIKGSFESLLKVFLKFFVRRKMVGNQVEQGLTKYRQVSTRKE